MSDRANSNRIALLEAMRQQPFNPFLVGLENGDRFQVRHPENLAFDPDEDGNNRVSILLKKTSVLTSLDAITGIAITDTAATLPDSSDAV
ncbi:MAG: hypothetical protein AAGI46_15315 [Planctomycetota bacterium]